MLFEIPVYCSQCQAVYGSGMVLEDTSVIELGVVQFSCPQGHTSAVPSGAYHAREGVLSLSGADGTISVLEKIRRLAADAVAGKADTEETIRSISEIAPGLAPLLKATQGNTALVILAMILWFAVEMTKALQGGGGSTTGPIHIENRPAIVNQITVEQGVPTEPQLAPANRSISDHKHKNSKRKKRRVRPDRR